MELLKEFDRYSGSNHCMAPIKDTRSSVLLWQTSANFRPGMATQTYTCPATNCGSLTTMVDQYHCTLHVANLRAFLTMNDLSTEFASRLRECRERVYHCAATLAQNVAFPQPCKTLYFKQKDRSGLSGPLVPAALVPSAPVPSAPVPSALVPQFQLHMLCYH